MLFGEHQDHEYPMRASGPQPHAAGAHFDSPFHAGWMHVVARSAVRPSVGTQPVSDAAVLSQLQAYAALLCRQCSAPVASAAAD